MSMWWLISGVAGACKVLADAIDSLRPPDPALKIANIRAKRAQQRAKEKAQRKEKKAQRAEKRAERRAEKAMQRAERAEKAKVQR